jgi:thiamine transport system permease protein
MSTIRRANAGLRSRPGESILFLAPLVLIALPLLAAFSPLFDGGAVVNMTTALSEPRFIRSFGYGLSQAGVSTVLALVIGLPGAYLMARKRFPGKRLLSALSSVPFCVPPLIVAIAFVLYYGRNGWLNTMLMKTFSLDSPPLTFLYSFTGIVLTHGFYNFPIIFRMVGDAWSMAPESHEEAASLLGASRFKVFLSITLPSIAPSIGAAASLVFLLCFFSFVIVLLFGGPGVATPEVELYRAARFEFNRPLASAFALVETLLALLVLWLYAVFEKKAALERIDSVRRRSTSPIRSTQGLIFALLYGACILVFFIGPLASIVVESLSVRSSAHGAGSFGPGNYIELFQGGGFPAIMGNTVWLGLASATLASIAGFMFSVGLKNHRSPLLSRVLPMLPLAVSGIVLAYGWSRILGGGSALAVVSVQAVSSYPFILRAIQGSIGVSDERYAEAAQTLGSSRLGAILRIRLPLAFPALMSGFAFAFAISAGDANALIIAPVPGLETLALYLFRLAGSYRFNEACATAVVLAAITGFVFFIKDSHDGSS